MELTSEKSTIGFRGYATLGEFLYVADSGNHRIQKLDLNGNMILEWGGFGDATGQFNNPWGVASDGSFVYVTDTGNDRVQVFDLNGVFQYSFGISGVNGGQFNKPRGVAIQDGWLYIVDTNNHRIQVFTAAGRWALSFGTEGDEDGDFQDPIGIAISGGWLYIDDRGNARVVTIQLNYVDPNYTPPPLEYPRNIKSTYVLVLGNLGYQGISNIEIPMKSMSTSIRDGIVTMNVVVPFTQEIEQAISLRMDGQLLFYKWYYKDNGAIEKDFLFSAPIDDISIYEGPKSASIVLVGRQQTTFRYYATVDVGGPLFTAIQKGRVRYRIAVNPNVLPKNKVILSGQEMEVGTVTISLTKSTAFMEFTET